MLFEFSYSQNLFFPELYNWVILTAWAALLLILGVIAFLLLGTASARNARWQYVVLVLIGSLGLWSLIVAYNEYQQWLHLKALLYAVLPQHGVTNSSLRHVFGPAYLAAIQICQLQFALTTSVLVALLCIAAWQFRRTFARKAEQARSVSVDQRPQCRWMSLTTFVVGLGCFLMGVFLLTVFSHLLIAIPQAGPFQFDEPAVLELIGFFTVSLGGPFILLLLSAPRFWSR